ncbi:MAG: 3-deoxy-manno-octulosonate cytidylyltransferase [Gammaproteobacteria bacterium]|nr:3-deoxy-manno-octulosonate cytidylyltransferase [Gammaproteobacteria bacterium]NNM20965.1 3-deoxy-manno-octulosonate cytidylyltransferase [Gammaproteobacteria bacterium]
MAFKVVIPARFASSRLPGKALRQLCGRTMLEHVWRIATASAADEVIVATDDERIRDIATQLGAAVIMTAADHPSGTDRITEVAVSRDWGPDTVVVNVQCDEPLLPPQLIDQVAGLLAGGADIATLAVPLTGDDDFRDPNVVKVVMAQSGRALYFSRAPVPFHRDAPDEPAGMLRHIGLYAYRVDGLKKLCEMPPCQLELTERLEQLRALWAGMRIDVALAAAPPGPGVDTAEDLARVEAMMEGKS